MRRVRPGRAASGMVLAVASGAIVWGVLYAMIKTAIFLIVSVFHH